MLHCKIIILLYITHTYIYNSGRKLGSHTHKKHTRAEKIYILETNWKNGHKIYFYDLLLHCYMHIRLMKERRGEGRGGHLKTFFLPWRVYWQRGNNYHVIFTVWLYLFLKKKIYMKERMLKIKIYYSFNVDCFYCYSLASPWTSGFHTSK